MMNGKLMLSCRMQFVSLILAGLILQPVRAGVIPGRWEKVENLDLGARITLELKNGDPLEGHFEGLSASGVDIETRSVRVVIPKEAIQTISIQPKDGLSNGAAIGAAVGAAIGAGVSLAEFAANGTGDLTGAGVVFYTLVFSGIATAIGAGLGAAADAGMKSMAIVIYEAPETAQ